METTLIKCPACGASITTTAETVAREDFACMACGCKISPSSIDQDSLSSISIETGKKVSAIAALVLEEMALIHTSMERLRKPLTIAKKKLIEDFQADRVNEVYGFISQVMEIVPEETRNEVQKKWTESIERFRDGNNR